MKIYLTLVMLPVLTASKPAQAPLAAAAPAPKAEEPKPKATPRPKDPLSEDDDSDRAGGQSDVQPVGPDYVEEVGGTMTIVTMLNHSDYNHMDVKGDVLYHL